MDVKKIRLRRKKHHIKVGFAEKGWVPYFLICAFLLSGFFEIMAWHPIVRHFGRQQHGGGSQTWDVVQDTLGRVCFGNKYGLMIFDGIDWNIHSLSNFSEVRSLYYDSEDGRLYAGGSGEFGYFCHNVMAHELRFHSLVESAKFKHLPEDIWNIARDGNNVWFQSDRTLYKWNGSGFAEYFVGSRISSFAIIDGDVYIGGEGFFRKMVGARMVDLMNYEMKGVRVIDIKKFPGGGIMVVTASDGLYLYCNGELKPLERGFGEFLKNNQAFCSAVQGSVIAVGTVNNGLVIYDTSNGKITYVNPSTGLQNNTVLSLGFDFHGNLWAGLDNGIDFIDYNSAVGNLLGDSGVIGSGYGTLLCGDCLWMASNQGLYKVGWPQKASVVPEAPLQLLQGQVWGLDTVAGRIAACCDAGLFDMTSGIPKKIEGIPGAWSAQRLKADSDYALVSSYEGFYLLKIEVGGLRNLGKIKGYDDIGGYFHQDKSGDIWLAHWRKGVYRLGVNTEDVRFDRVRFYDSRHGLPSDADNKVMIYQGRVVIATRAGYYLYDHERDKIKPYPELRQLFGDSEAGMLFETQEGDTWNLGRINTFSIARVKSDGECEVDSVIFGRLATNLVRGFEHIDFHNPHRVIISSVEGFYEANPGWRPHTGPTWDVYVANVRAGKDSLIYAAGDERAPDLDYSLNSLRFTFAAPEFREDNAVVFYCKLEGVDKEWVPATNSNIKEYTGLREGDYTLHFRAYNRYTRQMAENRMDFHISPPIYRSSVAWALYIILILIGGGYGVRWAIRWSQRKNQEENRKKMEELEKNQQRAEAERLLKEMELSELKGKQLEEQIKHKSAELSNIMMNMSRKNEILISVSNSLSGLKENIRGEEEIRKINIQINRLQSEIKTNISRDNDWRKFMHNFDSVYTGFIVRLKEAHPDLTQTEVRVCCYLRMGMNSKDIAPLFSISSRSVEMTRYRLRKKLQLKREDNLTSYLEKI